MTAEIRVTNGEEGARDATRVVLDFDKVAPPLVVRGREPGDRLKPLGAPGTRKVQDLLVDRKVPGWERDSIPIVHDAEGIIWVGGVEIADRVKRTAETTKFLEVAILKGHC